jgi:predicted DNA-binding protein (MmcQ/YjbR family)
MDAESVRAFVMGLPHVVETVQWGNNLVFWAGDKTVGGKMFCVVDLDGGQKTMLSFAAGPEKFAELLETYCICPAPYMARAHWLAMERWDALPTSDLKPLLAAARDLVYAKLPKRTRDALALPQAEFRKLLAERKKLLASGAGGEKKSTPAAKPAAQPKKRRSK